MRSKLLAALGACLVSSGLAQAQLWSPAPVPMYQQTMVPVPVQFLSSAVPQPVYMVPVPCWVPAPVVAQSVAPVVVQPQAPVAPVAVWEKQLPVAAPLAPVPAGPAAVAEKPQPVAVPASVPQTTSTPPPLGKRWEPQPAQPSRAAPEPPTKKPEPIQVKQDAVVPVAAVVAPPVHEPATVAEAHVNWFSCFTNPRFWLRGELLAWQLSDAETPPLAATGTTSSLGILGRPGTVVLFGGDIDLEPRLGARFTGGVTFGCDGKWGAEASGFFLPNRSVDFAAGSDGDPILTRPFFNALTGVEAAEQVANPALPGVLPLTGRVTASLSSRLWGLEANLTRQCCWSCCGVNLDLLGGMRFLQLGENLTITEDLTVPLTAMAIAGARFQLRDEFATENNFYGGQVGARLTWKWRYLSVEALGKVALGGTQQSVTINGTTVITPLGQAPTTFVGALLAQPTNIGEYEQTRLTILPEAGIRAFVQVTSHLRANLGYTFLYASNVARPGEQIDRVVNPSQLPPGNLVGPARPAFVFRDTDLWVHGVALGLEYSY